MDSEKRDLHQRAAFMCPACKQSVPSEIHRHKSLGIFVPVWRAGPCENPDCPEYAPREQHSGHRSHS